MPLDGLLNLFREHFFTTGVDALRPATQKCDASIRFNRREVSGEGVPDTINGPEGSRGLLLIFVVTTRHDACRRNHPHFARSRCDGLIIFVEHFYVFRDAKFRGFRGVVSCTNRPAHGALCRAHDVVEHHILMLE